VIIFPTFCHSLNFNFNDTTSIHILFLKIHKKLNFNKKINKISLIFYKIFINKLVVKNIRYLKEGIKDSWNYFISIAGREKRETIVAIQILKKLLTKQEVTTEEIRYLKSQSGDIAKIVGVMSLGVVSMAIPIALEKILNQWDISIMPKSQSEEEEKVIENTQLKKKND